jgi:DNA-binding FadR family transcriptional regulator
VPRAANLLVDELRPRILAGELAEGDLLPAERTLVEETGLGRATVREALRILETEGLISAGLGRYGGWVVQRPGRATLTRSIDVFIRGRQIRSGSLMEAREAIEPPCAALAALHRDEDDLAHIDACTASLRASWMDGDAYLVENVRWHLAVVAASHNELLIAIMTALADAVHAGTDIDEVDSGEVRLETIAAHERVVEAIRAGDADAAFRRMYRHIRAFRTQAGDVVERDEPLSPIARPPASAARRRRKESR